MKTQSNISVNNNNQADKNFNMSNSYLSSAHDSPSKDKALIKSKFTLGEDQASERDTIILKKQKVEDLDVVIDDNEFDV